MDYWMIASIALGTAFVAACIVLICQGRRMKRERMLFQQETDQLRGENIGFRREVGALEREFEEEKRYSESLEQKIDAQNEELQRMSDRVTQAENRRTDAEKEVYARRMQIEQLQNQLQQSHAEQTAQEQLYQDIIRDRDQTISNLQEKLHKRKKKKTEILDQQITLEDLFNNM